jgi:hypothetical protein
VGSVKSTKNNSDVCEQATVARDVSSNRQENEESVQLLQTTKVDATSECEDYFELEADL